MVSKRKLIVLQTSLILILSVAFTCVAAQQKSAKLPSAEKVVGNYLKAIGGKKQVASIRDATYEWKIYLNDQVLGIATTQTKVPAFTRSEMVFGNGQIRSATNGRSAWSFGLDGKLYTLTDAEAAVAKLRGTLDASRLVDFKKSNVLARVTDPKSGSTPAYVVVFSLRSGAALKYCFDPQTKLLFRIEDDARNVVTTLEDYRLEGSILEQHRVRINQGGTGDLTLVLQKVSYNAGINDSVFDPPRGLDSVDVVTLLREVAHNQDELERRFTEYSFRQKETDREINSKGEIKKQTEKLYEVYPIAHREPVMKLIAENGAPLSAERAAKEQKRVEEDFEKAERDQLKNEQKAEKSRAERDRKRAAKAKKGEDEDLEISQFLRVHEFISPRRESFRDREAVVFDFRKRPGFKPDGREEDLISKLVGVVWIDPVDKQIMRLEARLAEGFKVAGGLLVSLRPGAAVVFEQTRMIEGVWLPRLAQLNLTLKFLLFGGGDYNKTIEWSDYKHFSGDVGEYKLDAPKPAIEPARKP